MMIELENAREQIDRIDAQMAALFEARMKICAEIAACKKEHALPVRDPAREEALIRQNQNLIRDPEIASFYLPFLKQVLALSREYQARLNKEVL